MAETDARVAALAGAILDGAPIDWAAQFSDEERERALIEQLKLVATLADVCRAPHGSMVAITDRARNAQDMQPDVPPEWGHLDVMERIGNGAFGNVYRAWDTRLDREVALKLLTTSDATADSRATSVIEEGRLLARVRHPNVVTIYGADRIQGRVGLWMELVDGRTLHQMLEKEQSFSAGESVTLGIELCHAVEAVHAAGLLHRDIKAHNVMVASDGRVVLMDFGTGREREDRSATALAGTPLYMAPELLSGSAPTIQSDIYSLGVLLYHMLSRSYPVTAETLRRLQSAHDHQQRIELATLRRDLPSSLARVIDRATHPRPELRYPSVQSLEEALASIRQKPTLVRWRQGFVVSALTFIAWVVMHSGSPHTSDQLTPTGGSATAGIAVKGNVARNSTSAAAGVVTALRSIAVLPFKPLVAEDDDERLQLGLTEAVIDQIARIKTVKVEPLARVRRYSAPEQDPLAAGRSLGVDAVVSGYVQQSERGVLVRVRLVRTSDGAVLMTRDSTDQPFRDVLDAQSRMAVSLTLALQPALTPADRARVARLDTKSPEAFRHYLFGRYHMEVRSRARMLEAEREFREAIMLDPEYARAHAALSVALTHSAFLGGRKGVDVMGPAKAAATRALEIDDSVALAHTALGYVLECFEYNQLRSQAEHLRAMAIDDQDLWVVRAYASFLMRRGAFDESLAVIRRAVELDPVSPLSNRHHAMLLYAARQYDECIALTRRTLSLDPTDSTLSYGWLGRCLEAEGRADEAIEAYEDGRSARGNPALARRMKRVYQSQGWDAYWREQLRLIGDADRDGAAAALVRLGRLTEAVDVFERGFQSRAPWVGYINHPLWDPLLDEPRFRLLRDRSGLSDDMSAQLAAARAPAAMVTSR